MTRPTYTIRLKGATVPTHQTFTTEGAAIAEASFISSGQGGATWQVLRSGVVVREVRRSIVTEVAA